MTAADVIYFGLNLSLLTAVLVGPCVLAASIWYRRSLGKPVFVWPKPEMVVMTIVFFIISLVLFIVGVSCFFTHFGYLEPIQVAGLSGSQFYNLGLSCFLVISGLTMIYFGFRRLFVQMVMDDGVLVSQGLVPVPSSVHCLEWHQIVDYYVVPDYPNVSFTFITNPHADKLSYERVSIKVPIYLKEDFQAFLDKKLYSAQHEPSGSEISSSRFFSEN